MPALRHASSLQLQGTLQGTLAVQKVFCEAHERQVLAAPKSGRPSLNSRVSEGVDGEGDRVDARHLLPLAHGAHLEHGLSVQHLLVELQVPGAARRGAGGALCLVPGGRAGGWPLAGEGATAAGSTGLCTSSDQPRPHKEPSHLLALKLCAAASPSAPRPLVDGSEPSCWCCPGRSCCRCCPSGAPWLEVLLVLGWAAPAADASPLQHTWVGAACRAMHWGLGIMQVDLRAADLPNPAGLVVLYTCMHWSLGPVCPRLCLLARARPCVCKHACMHARTCCTCCCCTCATTPAQDDSPACACVAVSMSISACVHACVLACMRVCVCACVRVCVRAHIPYTQTLAQHHRPLARTKSLWHRLPGCGHQEWGGRHHCKWQWAQFS